MFVFCITLFLSPLLLMIELSVLLVFTDSDYLRDVFKLVLLYQLTCVFR